MANIEPKKSIDIKEELKNLELYKYHPNGIIGAALNRIKEIVDGKIEVVDPNNPFIYLLETNCLNTAYAIQEMTLLTRKLYPRLANTEEDLYLHMSDKDYVGRFSEPSIAEVNFNVLFSNFINNSYRIPGTNDYLLTIPKHFKISIDKYVFTLMSGVTLRLAESGIVDVRYEHPEELKLTDISNYIPFKKVQNGAYEEFINFKIRIPELDLEHLEIPVEKSKLFSGKMGFNNSRKFYELKAYYLDAGIWHEMLVTHTEQVYDIDEPTCVVQVHQESSFITYFIPPVYINGNMLGTKVKLVLYTTVGAVDIDFNDYQISDFKYEYNPVFPELDLNERTRYISTIGKVIFIEGRLYGGRDGKEFEKLKEEVINNSIGDRLLPITANQLAYELEQNNFRLIKEVDIVTDRIFLLETDIPPYSNKYTTSKLNLDLMEFKTSLRYLRTEDVNSVTFADINKKIAIIPEGTLFNFKDGILQILPTSEKTILENTTGNSKAIAVNSNNYLYSMYHYILNTEVDIPYFRAYEINKPKTNSISFIHFNETAGMSMNTMVSYVHKRVGLLDDNDPNSLFTGYIIDLMVDFKSLDNIWDDTQSSVYLMYETKDNSRYYLKAERVMTYSQEAIVYRFYVESNYYINENNEILITNFLDTSNSYRSVFVNITDEFKLMYCTIAPLTSFVVSQYDSLLNYNVTGLSKLVNLESYNITFATHLKHLYSRLRTSVGLTEYEIVQSDIVQTYDYHVYDDNLNIIHHAGTTVLDNNNEPVIKQYAGEILLDANGDPVPAGTEDLQRFVTILLGDYRTIVADDTITKEYKKFLDEYITRRIVVDVKDIQPLLLEKTKGYLTVPKTIDRLSISFDGKLGIIPARQKFNFVIYVNARVFEGTETRTSIEGIVINELDSYLTNNRVLSKTRLLSLLNDKLSDVIESISLREFTNLDIEYLNILDDNGRMSINKIITLTPDGLVLKDDVKIEFVLLRH